MIKTNEQKMAEAATGLYQTGDLVFFDENERELTKEQAVELLNSDNDNVIVPAAGAGSYREVFSSLGFQEVEVVCSQASAGDWTFGVKNERGWFAGQQENNYPSIGFRYVISPLIDCCQTLEELVEKIESF